MGLTQTTLTGKTTEHTADSVLSIITQNPESTNGTAGGLSVNGDIAVGVPFLIKVRTVSAAALKAVVTYTADIFAKNCPFKLEVLSIRVRLISYTQADWTDADGGNLDITVQDGDGAASESFTDVLADQVWDDTYTDGMQLEYPSATVVIGNATIDEDESLRCQMICDPDDTVVAAAGADALTMEFIVECIRVN